MKPRSDSALAALTEEQRDQLYDLLMSRSLSEAQEIVARPIADGGFDLKVHKTTLARFCIKEQEERHARELSELALNCGIDEMPKRIDLLVKAARQQFAHATYELAKTAASSDDYERLDRALHHMDIITTRREELAQERDRMSEQRRQWEFNVGRELMKNYVELERVHHTPNLDDEEKTWMAREIAFGKRPSHSDTLKHAISKNSTQSDTLNRDNPPSPSAKSVQSVVAHSVSPAPQNIQPNRQCQTDALSDPKLSPPPSVLIGLRFLLLRAESARSISSISIRRLSQQNRRHPNLASGRRQIGKSFTPTLGGQRTLRPVASGFQTLRLVDLSHAVRATQKNTKIHATRRPAFRSHDSDSDMPPHFATRTPLGNILVAGLGTPKHDIPLHRDPIPTSIFEIPAIYG